MKYVITIAAVLLFVNARAQSCDAESLHLKPGSWKESSGGTQSVPATDLARQKKTVAALHSMIKAKYSPVGVDAYFNGGYNRPLPQMPVNTYIYSIKPVHFYCEGGVVRTAHESSSYFHIAANFFSAEIYDTAQGDQFLAEGFNVLYKMPVEKDGYFYFEEAVSLGFGITGKSSCWLITYDGQLPYAYVSKKEFLQKRKHNLTVQMQYEASGIKDVLKNIETEKSFKEKEFKNDAAKLQQYMKMAYQPLKERYEKQLADITTNYKPAFDKVESLLQSPANELKEPAIVKNDPNDHLSYLFTDTNDPFAKILIKPNPGYFNKKLPKSSPQFFSVFMRGNPKDPVYAAAMNDILKAVDFSALKNMLGK